LKKRISHIKKVFKDKDLEIKNSPLDRYASRLANLIFCGKFLCEAAQPLGAGIALGLGADEILKHSGREPIFAPFVGSALDKVLPPTEQMKFKKQQLEAMNNLEKINTEIKDTEQLKSAILKHTGLEKDDVDYFIKALNERQEANFKDQDKLRKIAYDLFDKSKRK
jgi:hypothetical protein